MSEIPLEHYSISMDEPLVVYGGGQIGIAAAIRLMDSGYNVAAILDKHPDGVKDSPVIVLTPEKYFSVNGDAFVFVSLGDGIVHTSVARRLVAAGFTRVLFLPLFLGSKSAISMVHSWNEFYCGEYGVSIPAYDSLWNVSLEDFILHEDNSESVVVVVHKEYVRTLEVATKPNPYSDFVRIPDSVLPYVDKPISDVSCFSKNSADLDSFLQRSLHYNPHDFYTCCAAPSTLNEKGYFNLIDGSHRCCYMVEKGFHGLPLRVEKAQWESFFKERQAQELMNHCKSLDTLPLAVHHPAFVKLPYSERIPEKEFLDLFHSLNRPGWEE